MTTVNPAGEPQPCQARATLCRCALDAHPDTEPHRCTDPACGAVWFGEFDNPATFKPVVYPMAQRPPLAGLKRLMGVEHGPTGG